MAESINEKLIDKITLHQVNLERLKAGMSQKVTKILRKLASDLTTEIATNDPTAVGANAYRQARMEKLLTQTRATIGTTYKRLNKDTKLAMKELASTESEYQRALINRFVGVEIASVALSPHMLESIAGDCLVLGTKAEEWWKRQGQDTQRRFEDTIRQGMLRGEPLGDLIKRVRGTKANQYKDGIIQASMSNAAGLVRTAVQTVANQARNELYAANDDVIKGVMHVSTLDTRTTDICKERDGLVWSLPNYEPVGHSIPWNGGPGGSLHYGCRSTTAPVLKSWEELGATGIRTEGRTAFDQEAYFKKRLNERLNEQYADEIANDGEKNGVPIKDWIKKQVDDAVMDTRASMDGQVPASLRYEAWLRSKTEDIQIEALGKGKWELWKSGSITFSDLIDETGRPLTLEELKKKTLPQLQADIVSTAEPEKLYRQPAFGLSQGNIEQMTENQKEELIRNRTNEIEDYFEENSEIRYSLREYLTITDNDQDYLYTARGIAITKEKAAKQLAKFVNVKFNDFMQGIQKGIPADYKMAVLQISFDDKKMVIQSIFRNTQDEMKVINLFRTIGIDDTGKKYAIHELFQVPEDLQRSGIGKKILADWLDLYKETGVKYIKLHANIDVGGYAWARYGFYPESPEALAEIKQHIKDFVHSRRNVWNEQIRNEIAEILRSNDPKMIWKIANHPKGKPILMNSHWKGKIDLSDPEDYKKLTDYIGYEKYK
jgi:SPP1 gp7 family putative phage head morphogenesis protein